MTYDFGLVGLGVMGRNFILNVAQNGFSSIGLSSNQNAINLLNCTILEILDGSILISV